MSSRTRYFAAAALLCAAVSASAYDPLAGDFSKGDARHLRLLSYNVQQHFIEDASRDAAFDRVLRAINPDVICFQEIYPYLTSEVIVARLNATLPREQTWRIQRGEANFGSFPIQTVVAAPYPMSLTRINTNPEAATRGVTIALLDLPDTQYATDLYIMGVHLKSGGAASDFASRQVSTDAMVNWMRDARTPGGFVTLAPGTPMVVLGDCNMREDSQPQNTLTFGDIQDNASFGADSPPDWDGSSLLDVRPRNPYTNDADTWNSTSTNPTLRFDRFYVTDSVAPVPTGFVLNTLTMNSTRLAAAGLLQNDTENDTTTDHLPIVADLQLASPVYEAWVLF